MVTHRTGKGPGQQGGLIGEHQRMHWNVCILCPAGIGSRLGAGHIPGNALAPTEPPDEVRIGFVELMADLAHRITAIFQAIQIEVKCRRQCGAALTPFTEHDLQDARHAQLTEDAGVDALLHDRQRVLERELVDPQRTVGLAGARLGDDPVGVMQTASVSHHLDAQRLSEQGLQRQFRIAGHAGQLRLHSFQTSFFDVDPLHQQPLREMSFLRPPAQPEGTVLLREYGAGKCRSDGLELICHGGMDGSDKRGHKNWPA